MTSELPTTLPLQTFTLFSLLPQELRLQIWHHALQIPRLVTISWKLNIQTGNRYATRSIPLSPLLLISHESRSLALTHHGDPRTLSSFESPNDFASRPRYIGPGTDIVFCVPERGPNPGLFTGIGITVSGLCPELSPGRCPFAPPKRIAIEEKFLKREKVMDPGWFGNKDAPSAMWGTICFRMKVLEELIVVREEEQEESKEEVWNVEMFEDKVKNARKDIAEYYKNGGPFQKPSNDFKPPLDAWVMPNVRIMTLAEVESECWI